MVFRCELCDNFRGVLQISNLCDVCYEIRTIIKCYDRESILECLKQNFIVNYLEDKKSKEDESIESIDESEDERDKKLD